MTEATVASHEQPCLFTSPDDKQVVPTRDVENSLPAALDAVGDDGSERAVRTRRSMLWAAYGDALGFISELVDRKGLERRTQGTSLDHLMDWRRRVGGRSGVHMLLPAGCWSDDTQLRIAVSRSIGRYGFDAETFARIELPVWLSYALGGGRASRAAAKNLGKPRMLWYANTFPGWANAGGNGAAMRIQPHVLSSRDLDNDYMLDVITDSVCTHGHPRAIVGACFHAATLAHCLGAGSVPNASACADIAASIDDLLHLIRDHPTLGPTWVGLWEKETGNQLGDLWRLTVGELCDALNTAFTGMETSESVEAAYAGVIHRLGLRAANQQGSGILTTVAAVALASAATKAHEGVVTAANAVGTDTDTIATMAGSLLGACDGTTAPPQEPLDSAYLLSEADRLLAISQGQPVENHKYPDVLTWTAPQTQADALVTNGDCLTVEGLGPVTELEGGTVYTARGDFAWQWVRTHFGQTLLIKRRPEVRQRNTCNDLTPPTAPASTSRPRQQVAHPEQSPKTRPAGRQESSTGTIDRSIVEAREKISDDAALGSILRDVARERSLAGLLDFIRNIRDDLRG